jgi:hypothetical protein
MAKPRTVERFDFQRIDAARVVETPQGFLRVSGNLTRIGVLPYYRADGSVYNELRLPGEVFREDSLATMKLAPVTDLHRGMVAPSNVQDLQIGVVGEDVGHNDRFVTGSALIQRADAIDAVRSKKRCELSPGYRCWVEDGAGEWHGQKFDGTQRDIVYNHLAIGPKNWGRSGPDVALRMDGLSDGAAIARIDSHELGWFLRDRFSLLNIPEAEIAKRLNIDSFELGMLLDGFTAPKGALLDRIAGLIEVDRNKLEGFIPASEKGEGFVRKRDAMSHNLSKGKVPMKKLTIVLDGVAYEVEIPEALASNFESSVKKLQTKADSVATLEGELVAAKKATDDTQKKLDAANDPAALQNAIAERTKLVADVKKVAPKLDVDEKLDSKGLKVAALVASGYAADTFDGRDEAFVDGVFVGALSTVEKTDDGDPPPPVKSTRSAGPAPTTHTDGDPPPIDKYDSAAARERMVENNRKLSQGPLDATRPGTFATS